MDGASHRSEPPVTAGSAVAAVATAAPGGHARYALQPGLSLLPAGGHAPDDRASDGGFLFALRPLMAMRLNAKAFALVSALGGDGATAEAAGLAPFEARAFLDGLTRRHLLVRTPPAVARWPLVTIIVAARGRHRATRACVESLLALDYPGEPCEIIVVDDASDPPLAAAIADLPVQLIRLDRNRGQSAARNIAAAEAQGEVLAFIDNDCIADPAWLRTLVPHLDDRRVAVVGGRVIAPPPGSPVAAFEAVRSPLDMGAAASAVGPDEAVAYLPTCNLLARRDALLAVGGFATEMRLGEDVDFTWRVLRTGASASYVPDGRIVHHHRERLGPLLRRRADYGSSEADLQRRHPASHRVMPMPRVSLLALALLTVLPVAWPAGAALAVLLAAMLTREVVGKRRQIVRMGIPLPASRVTAAVLRAHLASMYGLSANLIRYYGIPLLALGAVWKALLPALAIAFLLAPVMDHRRLKPACGLATFIGLSWLEMAAYQLGVWRGCLARRAFRPLLPILHWKR